MRASPEYRLAMLRVLALRAVDVANSNEVQLKTQLSNLRDADLVEATMQMEDGKIHEQAAFSSRAMLPKTSLFDYLG